MTAPTVDRFTKSRAQQAAEHEAAAQERIEDIEFMAATGESFMGAAKRLGIGRSTLGNFLTRYDRQDLTRRLRGTL